MSPENGDLQGLEGPQAGESRPVPWAIYVEDVVIILCILPLWPMLLGWRGLLWQALLYGSVPVLVAIFVLRWRRARAALEAMKEEGEKGPQLPFMPPGGRL